MTTLIEASRAAVNFDLATGTVHVRLAMEQHDRRLAVVEPIANPVYRTIERGDMSQPAFAMQQHAFQALIDAAWEAGFRPTKLKEEHAAGSEAMKAVQAHLDDMRRLVFAREPEIVVGGPDRPITVDLMRQGDTVATF